MNLNEFRSTPRLVKAAIKLSDNDIFKIMMGVLWAEHPMHVPITRKVGVPENDPSYQLGTFDGACRVLQVLQSMTKPLKEGITLEPTYEPPNP